MSTPTPQRETAKICTIKELHTGTYVIQEGWLPNYVEYNGETYSRVNIIGIVVSKPSPYEFTLDDGTGSILVTDFNQTKSVGLLKIGDPVLVIGRPRQNNNTIFIACEICNAKQLKENTDWILQRQKALEHRVPSPKKTENVQIIIEDEETEELTLEPQTTPVQGETTGEDIIGFIRKKDAGDGCVIEEIISYFGNDVDDHILTLITMGEIYEIKPGRVKVLE